LPGVFTEQYRTGYESSNQGVCVQRDTYFVKRSFLQWLHKRSNPGLIVNLCFLVVLVFSTLLTWREVVVLEGRMSPASATIWKRSPVRWTDSCSSASINCFFPPQYA
jgi:hypothetical protein